MPELVEGKPGFDKLSLQIVQPDQQFTSFF
jgi:hypothetical protein